MEMLYMPMPEGGVPIGWGGVVRQNNIVGEESSEMVIPKGMLFGWNVRDKTPPGRE